MKTKVLFAFLLLSFAASAQYTLIPDINFENKLIALGIDSGTPDGKMLTSAAAEVKKLQVSSSSITDLTGIEDFTSLTQLNCAFNSLANLDVSKNMALTSLYCENNKLTTLDVSKNTALMYLDCQQNGLTTLDVSKNTALTGLVCGANSLTALDVSTNTALTGLGCWQNGLTTLDVSKNTALTDLFCYSNQLPVLDVSKNIALTQLSCGSNSLTTLDVSNNTALTELYCAPNQLTALDVSKNIFLETLICSDNKLTGLNLKNGTSYFLSLYFLNNPNLYCIQVDDKTYADANWSDKKDATATYSEDCSAFMGVNDIVFDKMSIYPIPTKGELHIDNVTLEKAIVYDASGKLVKSVCFENASDKNTLNLAGLVKGVYYVFIEAEGVHTAKQIIVE